MDSSRKTMNITIPSDQEENIRQYLALLTMQEEYMEIEEEKEENIVDEFEVKGVISHRITNGEFEFLLYSKTRHSEWIPDSDCSCEWLISKYTHKHNIKTAYLFCRVSTKEQAGQTHVSLDAQEHELRQIVNRNENERIKVIKISGSAYKNIPKAFIEVGEACIEGDSILIYRADRLSRNIVTYLGWLEDLNNRGIHIYSQAENMMYSTNKLEFIQAIVNAQKESALLGERIKMAYKRKRDRGDERVGRLPYGKKYRRTEENVMVVENNFEEQAIIFQVRSTKGSASDIAKKLNRAGIKKNGIDWNAGMVRRIKNN